MTQAARGLGIRFAFAIGTVIALASPRNANADWGPNGVVVSPFGVLQDSPNVAADGHGGAYVVWRDYRDYGTNNADVYLEHLAANGAVATGWPPDGLAIVSKPGYQSAPWISQDGFGNVFVLWIDVVAGGYNLGLQKVLADGSLAPGWPVSGLPVSTTPGIKPLADVCPDAFGGLYVTWYVSEEKKVYIQHIRSDGTLYPGWPINGRLVVDAPSGRCCPLITKDGSGGAVVAWADFRGGDLRGAIKYALRVDPSGNPAPGWNPTGVPLFTEGRAVEIRNIATDEHGGAFVAWDDNRFGLETQDPFYYDIYAQHVRGDGSLDPSWPAEGLPVCNAPSGQYDFEMDPDGMGGIVLIWEDFRNGFWQPFGQRILPDGSIAPGWTPNGVLLSNHVATQIDPRLASDGAGGFYAAWGEFPTGSYEVHGQRMLANGDRGKGWGPEGKPIARDSEAEFTDPLVVSDGKGGALLTFDLSNPTVNRVVAQRLESDFEVPALLSFVDAEPIASGVRLRWFGVEAGQVHATVERVSEDDLALWLPLGLATATAPDRLEYEDVGLAAGRYGYRLRYDDGGLERTTDVAWVVVEAANRLALSGFRPNPTSVAGARVWFSLPDNRPARLEVHDVSGRLVASHEVGSLGVGQHSVALNDREIRAGIYWFRLVRDEQTLTGRGVVLP